MSTQYVTWRNALALAAAALAPLCMGNEGCEDQFIGDKPVCEYAGKKYAAGDSFPATDGCNTCSCSRDGEVGCTLIGCLNDAGAGNASSGCTYDGKEREVGERFPSSDGCNLCSCAAGGQVECTLRACADGGPAQGGCEHAGKRYDVGESFPAADGCNTCGCQADGQVSCTAAFCADTCSYAGKSYEPGVSFDATDGCNTCSCAAGGAVACTDSACVCSASGWSRFRVLQTFGPCATDAECKNQWTVTPDREIETQRASVIATTTMSESDFCALVSIIADPAFHASMRKGFACDQPPTDIFYSLELELESETLKQSVTGCATTGPAGNLAGASVDIVNNY